MKFFIALSTLCAPLLPVVSGTIYFAGVAESGGEFGVWSQSKTVGTGLPGTFGREYAFIGESGVDTFVDKHKARFGTTTSGKRSC
jgi:endoglucanase